MPAPAEMPIQGGARLRQRAAAGIDAMRAVRRCLLPMTMAGAAADCSAQESGTADARAAGALAPVVVTATRSEQSSFDLPVSIDRIDSEAIRHGNATVNLSESLPRAPGVVTQNQQKNTQDQQNSIRGFGARSTFGVRGVRLY